MGVRLICGLLGLPINRPLKLADVIFTAPSALQDSTGTVQLSRYDTMQSCMGKMVRILISCNYRIAIGNTRLFFNISVSTAASHCFKDLVTDTISYPVGYLYPRAGGASVLLHSCSTARHRQYSLSGQESSFSLFHLPFYKQLGDHSTSQWRYIRLNLASEFQLLSFC